MERERTFTEGKIFAPLVRFMLPVLLALFLQTLYGAVDLWVVGKFAKPLDVSAVSTGSQLMMTITFAVTSLAMGMTVLVGRKLGAGKPAEAGRVIVSGIWLFGAVGIVLSLLLMPLAGPVARLMQAPEEAFGATRDYLFICGAGTVFIVAYNLIGSIFRGIGDSKMPLYSVLIACALNIAGDLFLVAVCGLGTRGAAYATVFAQAVSVLLSLLIIRKRRLPFRLVKADLLRPKWNLIGGILRLGVPIALQDMLVSVSFLIILAIVNSLGVTASAGVGVAEKLCGFVMLVPSAFMQSMSAFVAQNIGAEKPDRARKALLYGVASSLAVGVVMAYLNFFHGDWMAWLFVKDADVIAAAAEYLKAYAIDCLLTSFLFCFIGYFNGVGSTLFVMLQGVIGAFCVRVPISWAMSLQSPVSLFRVGLATPASSFVQIILCGIWFAVLLQRERKTERNTAPLA